MTILFLYSQAPERWTQRDIQQQANLSTGNDLNDKFKANSEQQLMFADIHWLDVATELVCVD